MLKIFNSGSKTAAQDAPPAWRLDLVGHNAHAALPPCLKQLLSFDAQAHGVRALQVVGARIGADGEIDRVYLRGPWDSAPNGVNRQEWAFDVTYLDSSHDPRLKKMHTAEGLKTTRRFSRERWLLIKPINDQELIAKNIFGDFGDAESTGELKNDMFMRNRLFRLNKAGRIDAVVGNCGSLHELIVRARLMGREYIPTPLKAFTADALSCFFRMGLAALPVRGRDGQHLRR